MNSYIIARKTINGMCFMCREAAQEAKWAAMPQAEWDGKAMLYSHKSDQYYSGVDEAMDACEERGDDTLKHLRLVICKPRYVTPLHYGDWDEWATDDGDLPAALEEAIGAFNFATAGVLLGWTPTNVRVAL
jgi:hypothetical protein